MKHYGGFRSITLMLFSVASIATLHAQGGGGGGGNTGGGGGAGGGGGTTTPPPTTTTPGNPGGGRSGTQTGIPTPPTQQMPQQPSMPIYVTGRVLLDNGTPPTGQVVIERV